MIVHYPESGDLIDDLRRCMQNNAGYGRKKLTKTLASEVERRLLHVGKRSVLLFGVRIFVSGVLHMGGLELTSGRM